MLGVKRRGRPILLADRVDMSGITQTRKAIKAIGALASYSSAIPDRTFAPIVLLPGE